MNGVKHDAQTGVVQRTNPLSFIVSGIASLRKSLFPIVAAYFALRDEVSVIVFALLVGGIGIAGSAFFSYLAWRRFTYQINEEDIRVEHGILSRSARSVPFERIQDVSLEQALLPRLFGLVAVKFETGSGAGDDIALAYLSEAEGERLRDVVRDRRDGAAVATVPAGIDGVPNAAEDPAPTFTAHAPGEVLFAMGPARLFKFGVFEFSLAIFAVLGGLFQYADTFWSLEVWDEVAGNWLDAQLGTISGLGIMAQVIGALAGLATLAVIGSVTGVLRTFTREWGFTLERTAKGFRRRRGLFTRTDVVMPAHRVQALQVATGMVRRRFGWHGLKFVSLAQDSGGASHDVAPFAQMEELAPIVCSAGFALPDDAVDWRRSSDASRNFSIAMAGAIPLLMAIGVIVIAIVTPSESFAKGWWVSIFPLAAAGLLMFRQAFLWRHDRNAIDDNQLYSRTGWLAPATTIANRVKLQSVEIKQGPIARRLGYATLHCGLAGGRFSIEHIPLERARALRRAIVQSIAATDYSQLGNQTPVQLARNSDQSGFSSNFAAT